ncbi:hypothetical protein BH09VER1_BH09VER1_12620 [soil metagenome]
MKYLISLLVLCLCSGCATLNKLAPKKKKPVAEKTTSSSRKKSTKVRTDELVKAYSVGRYSDPELPEVMHEQHTIYRVEQSPDWNYMPDAPSAPTGPALTPSSSSYYAKADAELMSGQQRAQVDALREQNRALEKRIDALKQDQSKSLQLQAEIDRLKKERDSLPSPVSSPAPVTSPEPAAEPWSDFSNPN